MDFWSSLGDFFDTFEAKDWTTAVLALVAIVVSMWTASQTWRYHPRPLLVIDYQGMHPGSVTTPLGTSDGPSAWVALTNRGNGPAHDVAVTFTVKGDSTPKVYRFGLVEPDGGKRADFGLAKETRELDESTGQYQEAYEPPYFNPAHVKAKLSWRQSPRMRWVRKRRVKLPALVRDPDDY